jgi:outer membrane protein TolC
MALAIPAMAEPVPFQRVIELALQNHGMVAIAIAEQRKSEHTLREANGTFLPAVTLGSGLGYSYGVPLSIEGSAPSIFNVTSQQLLFNMPQRTLVKALRMETAAAASNVNDKREAVILEAALAYIELDSALRDLKSLETEQKSAERVIYISSERLKEGIDSQLDLKRSQLSAARVKLRTAQVMSNVDLLRERLSTITGLSAASLETVSESIPKPQEISQEADYTSAALDRSPSVRMAEQRAKAAELRAQAEAKGKLPTIDLASQYAMLARFNNYDEFYRKYSRNNYSIGISLRFPVLSFTQGPRIDAANEDAVKAKRELDGVRAQVKEQTLKLQRSLRQLSAAAEVARLDYEVADASAGTVEVKLQSGEASSREIEQARIETGEKFLSYQEASLEYLRAHLQLLRMIGELQKWAGQ